MQKLPRTMDKGNPLKVFFLGFSPGVPTLLYETYEGSDARLI